jgi:hypothetical protein
MCDGEPHGGASNENEGKDTPTNVSTRNAARTGGVAMPPPMGQSQPQLEQLRELERRLEEERQ